MAEPMDESLENIQKLKVSDLKKELKARGLPTTGLKNELVERLDRAVQAGLQIVLNDSGDGEISDLNEDDEFDDDILADIPINLQSPVEDPLRLVPDKPPAVPSNQVTTKPHHSTAPKICRRNLLSYNVSATQSTPVTNSHALPKLPVRTMIVKRTQPPSSTTTIPATSLAIKTVAKLSDAKRLELRSKKYNLPLSEADKKSVRAQRFGAGGVRISSQTANKPLSDSAKKAVRAQRFGGGGVTETSQNARNGNSALTAKDKEVDLLWKRAQRFGAITAKMQQIDEKRRILKRKERFGPTNPKEALEVQKLKRAERFGMK